jgi:DnaJ-class molecular chaperone
MLFTKKKCINGVLLGLRCLFSHYETLGVEMEASQQEIKNSFYKLAKKYHPDLAKETSNEQKFIKIQEAYEVLGDEQKRKDYDQTFQAYTNTNQYGAHGHPYRNSHEHSDQYTNNY